MPAQGTGALKTQGGWPPRDTGCVESRPTDRNVSTEPGRHTPQESRYVLRTHSKEGPLTDASKTHRDNKCQMRSKQDPTGSRAHPVRKVRPKRCTQFQKCGRGWGVPTGRAHSHKQGPWSGEDRLRLRMPLPSHRPTRLLSRQRFGNLQPRMCQNRQVS